MPSLSDNGFNRYIYRDTSDFNTSDVNTSASQDIAGSQSSNANPWTSVPADGLNPGSQPVQGVLLQTSGSDNRVELNPDDHLYAYNDGDVVVEIGKDGIDADNAVFTNTEIDELVVNNHFTYGGVPQPIIYTGVINADGTSTDLPAGWTSSLFGVGVYIITHTGGDITNNTYKIVCAPLDGHYRYQVILRTATNTIIDWQQTNYITASFPVIGGGGGSVTVSGVRGSAPAEISVNTGFMFILTFYPA